METGSFDVQQVCLNGHQATNQYYRSPSTRQDFCLKCGAGTITACPNCGSGIKGYYNFDSSPDGSLTVDVPQFCENCGEPFPWSNSLLNAASLLREGELADALTIIGRICNRFHLMVKQLRKRYDRRATLDVQDEYDVQDVMHSLLRLFFDDLRPEEYAPSLGGKATRMDFLLKGESIVLETKMTRKNLGAKEVADELILDIARYKTHPSCKTLICFVYDPEGWVNNPHGLENDLRQDLDGFFVRVIVVPKGL